MKPRLPTLALVGLLGSTAVAAPAAGAGALTVPAGEYGCYTYNPRAVRVGVLVIRGDSYESKTGASGKFRMLSAGRVDFQGAPPLGFAVGVLEETEPTPKLRLYRQAADVGNEWKAAVCTLEAGGTTAAVVSGASRAGNTGAAGFANGQHVEANFIGAWYKANVVRCDVSRCLLHYDDPGSKDEWVDQSRLRVR